MSLFGKPKISLFDLDFLGDILRKMKILFFQKVTSILRNFFSWFQIWGLFCNLVIFWWRNLEIRPQFCRIFDFCLLEIPGSFNLMLEIGLKERADNKITSTVNVSTWMESFSWSYARPIFDGCVHVSKTGLGFDQWQSNKRQLWTDLYRFG